MPVNDLVKKVSTGIQLVAGLCLLSVGTAGYANTPLDAQSIVNKSNLVAFYPGQDGRGSVKMLIVDERGKKQRRQFSMVRRNASEPGEFGGEQQFFVKFSRPRDIKNTTFRVEKHIDQDDDRWLYLPALDLVKRISAGDKRTSFMGTHLFYEDLTGRSPKEDVHVILEDGKSFYKIKSTPKEPKQVEFTHYHVWVDKKTFMPTKFEYFDNTNQVYRTIENVKFENIEGYVTVTNQKVSDLRNGGYTLIKFQDIDYDVGVPSAVFSEKSLRSPSVKWF
ncbi:outer membrane lipoprotein-sorting protein [Pseudoalteromonas sp. OOF1S-7]|uniref:outer membrane lipoprotein-sorting protein n=1 Tax=Pseudoalteromonas sp. OOF1S-7 TaxID=2917757 RepID=UPI001EF64D2F|nr:outer membrane lipoprotein-sorting protein [Pseudoalteromonas sp. OOF1S-7]MCG7534602.1 outer membrane lipoprotein-sorting protein [Pseudoalteromonas sp. OOF1S-7]